MSYSLRDAIPLGESTAVELAQERVLADLDEFDEFLGVLPSHATSDWCMRQPERLAEADTATVLHALLTCRDDELPRVRRELVERYLRSQAERIDELVAQAMLESA